MRLWKVTDRWGYTNSGGNIYQCSGLGKEILWGPMVTHTAAGTDLKLCTDGVIHAYLHPVLARFLNPAHGAYHDYKLWLAEGCATTGIVPVDWQRNCSKVGVRTLTTIRAIDYPLITAGQLVDLMKPKRIGISIDILSHRDYEFYTFWNKRNRNKEVLCNHRAASFMLALIEKCPNVLNIINEIWPVNQDGVV